MIKRIIGLSALGVVFASAAWADDATSGMPTGKRQHKPLTVTKEIDKATPAMNKSESIDPLADDAATRTQADDTTVDDSESSTRGAKQDAKRRAKEVAEQTRASDDDVAKKTDKSEAVRARKRPDGS
jgi:hypothetical protein